MATSSMVMEAVLLLQLPLRPQVLTFFSSVFAAGAIPKEEAMHNSQSNCSCWYAEVYTHELTVPDTPSVADQHIQNT